MMNIEKEIKKLKLQLLKDGHVYSVKITQSCMGIKLLYVHGIFKKTDEPFGFHIVITTLLGETLYMRTNKRLSLYNSKIKGWM